MNSRFKPSFYHYFVSTATFLVTIMFFYPLYSDDYSRLFIYLPVCLIIALLVFRLLTRRIRRRNKTLKENFPDEWRELLNENVKFYRKLASEDRVKFEKEVYLFLSEKKVTGVSTEINDLDRLLVASSAIIPIFSFPEWEYNHLDEVLIYPNSFNDDFETAGADRSISGMVGNGIMNGKMILSKKDLHFGFKHPQHKKNVGIHEFVHLLDESDGSIDGVPNALMEHKYAEPWLRIMHQEMEKIRNNNSDINSYGATTEEEFLPVASEYFFQRPGQLKSKHPELYKLLNKIFHQNPMKMFRKTR